MADWAMVALTAVYVVATIFICYFNYRSAKTSKEQLTEMRRQYAEENRPYITVELIYERRVFYGLRFTNHGKKVANHVNIQLSEDFLQSLIEPSFKSTLENQKGRECIIGIGQHYYLYFGSNKFRENPNKVPVSGRIEYADGRETYSDDLFIDFSTYATFFSINNEADDFLKEMKDQTSEIKKLREELLRALSKQNSETDN